MVVERCLQRPTPSQRAFFGLCRWPGDGRLGRQPPVPKWTGTPPRQCRRGESSAPDAVAAWPLRRGGSNEPGCGPIDTAEGAHPRGMGHASSTPRRRVVHRTQSRRAKGQGEGSVRTGKTRTLRIPARYGLGQICGAETKPARFASGLWVDPPEGWVDWVWLIGYKRGVRERDEACETRSR